MALPVTGLPADDVPFLVALRDSLADMRAARGSAAQQAYGSTE